MTLVYMLGSQVLADDFQALGEDIAKNLEVLNGSRVEKSCAISKDQETDRRIFEHFAQNYELKEKCITQICPKISEQRTKPNENPFDPKFKNLEARLRKTKLALKRAMASEVALESEHPDWLKKMFATDLKGTPSFRLATLGAFAEKDVKRLIEENNFGSPTKLSSEQISNLHNKFSILSFKDRELLISLIEKLVTDKRVQFIGISDLGAPYRYKKQFPNLTFQEAARRDLEETNALLSKTSPEVKLAIQQAGLQSLLRHEMSSSNFVDELKGQEILRITDQIQMTIAIHNFTPDKSFADRMLAQLNKVRKTSDKPSTVPMQALSKGIENKRLKDLMYTQWKLNKTDQLYFNCMYSIAVSAVSLPTPDEVSKFNTGLPGLRAKIAAAIRGKYSHISGQILDQFISTVSVFTPPSNLNYLDGVVSTLNVFAGQADTVRAAGATDFRNGAAAEQLSGHNESTGIEEIQKLCRKVSYHPVRDNTVTALQAIAVGSDSVKDEGFGLGTTAHEFGHSFKSILNTDPRVSSESRGLQKKTESCLTDLHKDFFLRLADHNKGLSTALKDPRQPNHFLEEDYADLVSALVPQVNNSICHLGPDGLSLGANLPNLDRHSSTLFRALSVEAASGRKLPAECKQFLETNGISIKKCL